MGFSLNDVMQQSSRKKEKVIAAPKIHMIHYSKLHKSENQFYSENGIEELAEAIQIGKGIKQPLEVKRSKTEIGKYEIIAGHRRRLASIHLTKQGYEGYEFLPCIISNDNDIVNRINLILTNRTQRRKLSAFELMKEVEELSKLIKKLEEETGEKVSARVLRKEIADALGISETRVANMQNIDRNLSEKGKEKMKAGKLNVSAANELAGLPEDKQDALLETKESLSIKDVKKEKEKVSGSDTEERAKQKKIDKIVQCASGEEKNCISCMDKECIRCGGFRVGTSVKKQKQRNDKESVSGSDTNFYQNNIEDIPPGQMDICDYKGVAPNGVLSRKKKIEILKDEIKNQQTIINDLSGESNMKKLLLLSKIKVEAFEFYIKYLQKEIQE